MLAINGGKPVRESMLYYGRQVIDDLDIQAVVNCLRSDFLTTGPLIDVFESTLTAYTGAKYAVAFSNGTAALHAACFAAGITKGDEVITTPITFAASANSVLYCGGEPVFADINLADYMIDPKDVRDKITSKTKAIIPVDFTGEIPDMDRIMHIAKENGLVVIEDGAHSIGSEYKGRKSGAIADMTMFSFHPVKTITTGEGGAILTDSEVYYNRLKMFRSHGITRDKELLRDSGRASWYYEQQELGYNYRMTDIQAALGISQMNRIEGFKTARHQIVHKYDEAFQELKGIHIAGKVEGSDACRHLYVLRLDREYVRADRDLIFKALQAENIGVNLHYVPVYKHPYYQDNGYAHIVCPNAETYYESAFTIPLHAGMSIQDTQDVINAVIKVINYYRERS